MSFVSPFLRSSRVGFVSSLSNRAVCSGDAERRTVSRRPSRGALCLRRSASPKYQSNSPASSLSNRAKRWCSEQGPLRSIRAVPTENLATPLEYPEGSNGRLYTWRKRLNASRTPVRVLAALRDVSRGPGGAQSTSAMKSTSRGTTSRNIRLARSRARRRTSRRSARDVFTAASLHQGGCSEGSAGPLGRS